jgi:hypothetical protein
MAGKWKEVVRLRFVGDRFRDHALDLSALGELRQFQKMVAETAKALWRVKNPTRERLPRHFEERTRLCLRRIEDGSATAPLEVFLDEPEQKELFDLEPVELKEAIDLAHGVFTAANEESPLPDAFPGELLDEYAKWGQKLADDEYIEFIPPDKSPSRVDKQLRNRLIALSESPHGAEIDVTGVVLEADVKMKRFQLWLDEKTAVKAFFTDGQEDDVISALKGHRELSLRLRGEGSFSPNGVLRQVTMVTELHLIEQSKFPYDPSARPIESILSELTGDISENEWDNLPGNLSENLDHYLYGTPKK